MLLLTNILPLQLCLGQMVVRWVPFLFIYVANARPMWLKDDLTQSCVNHIMFLTRCTCCAWLACFLIVLYYVILPDISTIVHHIIGYMSYSNFSFPTLEKWSSAHWHFSGSAYELWFGWLSHFLWHCLFKNVLQSPWCLFDLLSQVLLWGFSGVTYVFLVLCTESAVLLSCVV